MVRPEPEIAQGAQPLLARAHIGYPPWMRPRIVLALTLCVAAACGGSNPPASTGVVVIDLTASAPPAPAPPVASAREEIEQSGMLGVLHGDSSEGNEFGFGGLDVTDPSGDVSVSEALGGVGGMGTPGSTPGSGLGGLGLRGGGGAAIGLGSIGTIGGQLGRRRGPSTTLRAEPPTVQGALDDEAIARIVRRQHGAIRYCYERERLNQPTLEGRLVVDFVIAQEGVVTRATSAGTFASPNVQSCVEERFRRMIFPRPTSGIVRVTYPFVFTYAKPRLASKPASEATLADVEAALQQGGATSRSTTRQGTVSTIAFTWDGAPLVLTFVPFGSAASLPAPEGERLRKLPAVFDRDGILLAIEGDPERARAALGALTR